MANATTVHATTCAIEAIGFCTCGRSAASPSPRKREWVQQEKYDALLAENGRLRDLFRPEPYHGVRFKLVCSACGGHGEVNGRNSDDPRWVQCLTCNGTGLAQSAREALSRV